MNTQVINPESALSFEDFKSLATKQSIVSNWTELLADIDTPVSVYARLRQESEDAFLFESVIGGEKIGRYSFIGYKALDIISDDNEDPYQLLEDRLAKLNLTSDQLPFFHQGFVGYFSFETVRHIEPSIKMDQSQYPELYMILAGSIVVFDHVMNKIYILSNSLIDREQVNNESYLRSLYDQSIQDLDHIKELIANGDKLSRLDIDTNNSNISQFSSNTGEQEYQNIVDQAKEHIKEGDIFQVVLSHKLSRDISVDPLTVYRILRTINPSPYLFIYNFKSNNGITTLVGSSPEMLVKSSNKIDNQGNNYQEAEIRPIAGTYKRGANEIEDQILADKLLQDPKEIAEHTMLVDLARNDLGRVCENGSIEVPQSMIIEKYSHVLHIVSSVIGKIRPGYQEKSGIELLKACFPAGTLSGAPKVEALKIIAELEHEARGPYGGTIGYFALDGTVDVAIMIRTLLINKNHVEIQAGAGIVADSIAENELQETYNKASALIQVIDQASR